MFTKAKLVVVGLTITTLAGMLLSFGFNDDKGKKKKYQIVNQKDGVMVVYDTIIDIDSPYTVEQFLADKGLSSEGAEIVKIPYIDKSFYMNMDESERTGNKHLIIKKEIHQANDKETNEKNSIEREGESVRIEMEINEGGELKAKKFVNGQEVELSAKDLEQMKAQKHRHKSMEFHIDDDNMSEEEKTELKKKVENELIIVDLELDSLHEILDLEMDVLIEELHNGDKGEKIIIKEIEHSDSENMSRHIEQQSKVHIRNSKVEDFTLVIVTEFVDSETESNQVHIREKISPEKMIVFPNPNDGGFTIQFDQKQRTDVVVTIIDASGKVVFEDKLENYSGSYRKIVDLKNNGSGSYVVTLNRGKDITTQKIIVKK